MDHPIHTLMHEHRVIEQVLSSLDAFATAVAEGGPAERDAVRDYARFFSGFADRCHHGKEEERLFAALVRAGLPREAGPIAVMLHEHELGRQHVRALAAVGAGTGSLDPAEREALVAHATAFVELLRAHIAKEDGVLFPMAAQRLSPETLARLAEEFEAFERDVMGAGEHERLHQLGERLVAGQAGGAPATFACGCHATTAHGQRG